MSEKVLENRLRRLAAREGYVLRKSRAREWRLENRQEYMLVDASTNISVRGSYYDADLDEIAEFLAD
jgi:hypothetical protein